MRPKISWVILTFNRARIVRESVAYNIEHMGVDVDYEIIHIDNGSTEKYDIPNVSAKIQFSKNKGVSKGYNAGMLLAQGEYLLITGCDRKMPDGWLAKMLGAFETIPNTGIVSCHSHPIEKARERLRGRRRTTINSLEIVECMPMEARILKRDLLMEIGYFREDFGIYGHEDLEWADRAERVTAQKGLINYTFPNFIAEHTGIVGAIDDSGKDDKDYWDMKRAEVKDPWKEKLLRMKRGQKNPFYNPTCYCSDKDEKKT